jgi:acetyl esterase/lipase
MIRFTLLLFCILATITIEAAPGSPTVEERLAIWLKKYPQADLNEDGKLTEAEATKFREATKGSAKTDKRARKKAVIKPTFANVSYGDHERNVFDLWIPQANSNGLRFPILIYFHGGGFIAGDKSAFDPKPYLDAGIACASANYRFVDGKENLSEVPLKDSARVLQTIRNRAVEFGIDSGRVALSGSSAGAVISMWIAFSDDLAQPDSEDPVSHESTRVSCIMPINGPTNLMPSWIIENIGGARSVHSSYVKLYGVPAEKPMTPEVEEKIKAMSAWNLVSEDDPPTMMIYSGALNESLPLPAETSSGKIIHHPYFGKALKEKLDESGVENELLSEFRRQQSSRPLMFLMTHFGMIV